MRCKLSAPLPPPSPGLNSQPPRFIQMLKCATIKRIQFKCGKNNADAVVI